MALLLDWLWLLVLLVLTAAVLFMTTAKLWNKVFARVSPAMATEDEAAVELMRRFPDSTSSQYGQKPKKKRDQEEKGNCDFVIGNANDNANDIKLLQYNIFLRMEPISAFKGDFKLERLKRFAKVNNAIFV